MKSPENSYQCQPIYYMVAGFFIEPILDKHKQPKWQTNFFVKFLNQEEKTCKLLLFISKKNYLVNDWNFDNIFQF